MAKVCGECIHFYVYKGYSRCDLGWMRCNGFYPEEATDIEIADDCTDWSPKALTGFMGFCKRCLAAMRKESK